MDLLFFYTCFGVLRTLTQIPHPGVLVFISWRVGVVLRFFCYPFMTSCITIIFRCRFGQTETDNNISPPRVCMVCLFPFRLLYFSPGRDFPRG
ncbi:hypothetical protein F4824DRAFT_87020 [Ustulina deusta]|nr:hypothetical protein F4824DRAFT_87020 [Ustulina deusta]